MNTFLIYERLPIFLQSAIVAHYGRKLHRMRFGGAYAEQMKEVVACERMGPSELRGYQAEKIRALLALACADVPHYRSRSEEYGSLARSLRDPSEIAALPVVEKSTVAGNPALFHSERPAGKRIYGNTSGTTGRPLRIMKTAASYQRNWAYYERCRRRFGIEVGMRRATFGTRMVVPPRQKKPPFWRYEPAENNLYLSLFHLSQENLPLYVERLREWRPESIVCFPSAFSIVAGWMIEKGIVLEGVRATISMAETLFDWQRERIAQATGGRVVNLYGQGEYAAWIEECPSGRLHIRTDYACTELRPVEGAEPEETGGSLFEIVSTGFINEAMPLVRYRTGDQVLVTKADEADCGCGLRFPTVTRVIGRLDDNLVTADGRVQTRLDGVFKAIAGVAESQIEQLAPDRLVVRIVPLAAGGPVAKDEVLRRLHRIFGDATSVEFQLVTSLPKTRAGKVRYQINSMSSPGTMPRAERIAAEDG